MDYKRRDIVLVDFNPLKKKEKVGKVRPSVILSDTQLNEVLDLVTVVALTTNLIDDAEPLQIRIAPSEHLEKESDAMVEQLRSVSKRRIGERLGSLSEEELEKIAYGVRTMLVL